MSFNGATKLHPMYRHLSKGGWAWRLERHENTLWHRLWWEFCKGPTVIVNVPNDTSFEDQSILPHDIYFFYKPWLDKNVGKQGLDWDWRSGPTRIFVPPLLRYDIVIKVRESKKELASLIALKLT